jgi:hypothetical protein
LAVPFGFFGVSLGFLWASFCVGLSFGFWEVVFLVRLLWAFKFVLHLLYHGVPLGVRYELDADSSAADGGSGDPWVANGF